MRGSRSGCYPATTGRNWVKKVEQYLQKVGQVGMLKALGASNLVVALGATTQIVATYTLGVIIGCLSVLLLTFALPPKFDF